MVQKEILPERKIPRNELLDNEKSQENDSKLILNVRYYSVFKHLKSQLKELHIILACDEDHKKVFPKVPIIGFRDNKDVKSYLVRAVLPGRCQPCGEKRPPFQFSSNTKNTITFKSKHSKVHIVIFGKSANRQTKPVTRNVFTKIICRITITGFVTETSQ